MSALKLSKQADKLMALFTMSYDPVLTLLEWSIEGYWSMDDFRQFETELSAQHIQITKKTRYYRALSDARLFAVQAPEVTEAFAGLFLHSRFKNVARLAMLVASALASIQAKRLAQFPNVRVFAKEDEARRWLLEDSILPG